MEGLIEVRFFMTLSELVKKRQWDNPLRLALAETDPLAMLIHDPQTSGGLVLSLARSTAEALLERLSQRGYGPECRIIGEVRSTEPGLVVIT